MPLNNKILLEKEKKWTAFLNGEPNITGISDLDPNEKADLAVAWEAARTHYSYSNTHTDQAWQIVHKKLKKTDNHLRRSIFRNLLFKYAAMIVVFLGIGYTAFLVIRTSETKLEAPVRMEVTEIGSHPVNISVITLPDGSTVKLNAGTKIEYPEHFAHDVRKIKLSGEAFFDVTRDSLHPFIIDTEHASVEVLGTSFNVSAYPHASLVSVNVETGKVKLTQYSEGKSGRKSAILPAGECGWLSVADGEIVHVKSLAPNYSSWVNKKINFQRTPLTEVFSVLENTYHVNFRLTNPEIGRIPYTANFADLNLEYIVEVIARTHHLKVKRNGDEIIFTRNAN